MRIGTFAISVLLSGMALAQKTHADLPSAFVIGDSTASNTGHGLLGWGDPFVKYFDPAKVTVINRARAGRSSRTFQTEGLWDRVMGDLKPGDFVLIQFGHNDAGPLDTGRARGSLPGTGPETQDIILPNGASETVHTYGWYMRQFVAGARSKGASPIILSLTVRNIWKDGRVERGSGNFNKWAADVAQSENVPFLDLTNRIADQYENMGQPAVAAFFPGDHTHTNAAGADFNARLIVEGLKAIHSRLATYLMDQGLPEPADPKLPSLFLIGDSTVRNGRGDGANGEWGWGDWIGPYFDSGKINVVNRAVGGLSSRTYLTAGHWDRVLALMKPGDFVMLQFGHNDSGPLDDASRARGSIPGTGEETREIDNPITKQREVVHTYGWYLRRFIADTRSKGATPIVCSPVPRKIWKDGLIARSPDSYAKWAADVARSQRAAFIDLNELVAKQYDRLGPDKVDPLFADPHTHTSLAGAKLNAASVISGLNALETNPLQPYLLHDKE